MRTREKENRSKETKPESTHLAIFFFAKQKEDLTGGTTAAKTSSPLGGRSGIAGTRAPEEADIGAPEELGTGATEELGTGATEELNIGAIEELGTRAAEEPDAGALEKLVSNDRLLQRDQDQCQNKKKVSITGK